MSADIFLGASWQCLCNSCRLSILELSSGCIHLPWLSEEVKFLLLQIKLTKKKTCQIWNEKKKMPGCHPTSAFFYDISDLFICAILWMMQSYWYLQLQYIQNHYLLHKCGIDFCKKKIMTSTFMSRRTCKKGQQEMSVIRMMDIFCKNHTFQALN